MREPLGQLPCLPADGHAIVTPAAFIDSDHLSLAVVKGSGAFPEPERRRGDEERGASRSVDDRRIERVAREEADVHMCVATGVERCVMVAMREDATIYTDGTSGRGAYHPLLSNDMRTRSCAQFDAVMIGMNGLVQDERVIKMCCVCRWATDYSACGCFMSPGASGPFGALAEGLQGIRAEDELPITLHDVNGVVKPHTSLGELTRNHLRT